MTKLSDLTPKAPKILLYSPAGKGKTALALTCGESCQIMDLDDGTVTGVSLKDSFLDSRKSVDVVQFLETDALKATAYKGALEYVKTVAKQCREGTYKYKVLVIDSLTALDSYCMRYVMQNSGGILKKIELQHWGVAFQELKQFLLTVRSLPIAVILLAHEQPKGASETEVTIAISGRKMPAEVLRFFDEVWYLKARPAAGGKVQRVLQTVSDARIECRSRFCIADGTDVNVGMPKLLEQMGYKL